MAEPASLRFCRMYLSLLLNEHLVQNGHHPVFELKFAKGVVLGRVAIRVKVTKRIRNGQKIFDTPEILNG